MKVAIVHDWLVTYGGAEWTILNWHKIFPDAPIYTLVYDQKKLGKDFGNLDIRTTYIQKLPLGKKLYKNLLPLMPGAWERLDLTDYDLVLSSCSSCSKGIITRPDAVHICYCHTPTRYLWDMYYEYLGETKNPIKKMLMPPLIHKLRMWDKLAADRVDYFIANSEFTKQRIKKYYHRDSTVIYSVGGNFVPEELYRQTKKEDFYLVVGRQVAYKRVDLAIKACLTLNKKLVVIGKGPESDNLKKLAQGNKNIIFLGYQPNEKILEYYAKAKALLFPGKEDFGFTPVEAQTGGTPVLAFGQGGALETVKANQTGLFFQEQTEDSLIQCIERFEREGVQYTPEQIRAYATETFSTERFKQQIHDFCMEKYQEFTGKEAK